MDENEIKFMSLAKKHELLERYLKIVEELKSKQKNILPRKGSLLRRLVEEQIKQKKS